MNELNFCGMYLDVALLTLYNKAFENTKKGHTQQRGVGSASECWQS